MRTKMIMYKLIKSILIVEKSKQEDCHVFQKKQMYSSDFNYLTQQFWYALQNPKWRSK